MSADEVTVPPAVRSSQPVERSAVVPIDGNALPATAYATMG